MGMVLVNGRVEETVKRRAEEVLAAHSTTPSQAIRALYQHMSETRQLPDFLSPDPESERAARERRLEILRSVAGISHSEAIAADADAERILGDELERRHA
ncbi:MAG: type II toxin-antitoxin system RelB/DinJ family antitoxin [Bifidobacteriaceae bacterium]|jgi:antitoxin component of RelBE/YafQ-DinJ toxin-antitoxin module|nr:type II toxin-antitoxin system RelB/DinJ family antitoxin [Bifidobacteriaceae bacterium]